MISFIINPWVVCIFDAVFLWHALIRIKFIPSVSHYLIPLHLELLWIVSKHLLVHHGGLLQLLELHCVNFHFLVRILILILILILQIDVLLVDLGANVWLSLVPLANLEIRLLLLFFWPSLLFLQLLGLLEESAPFLPVVDVIENIRVPLLQANAPVVVLILIFGQIVLQHFPLNG